MSLKTRNTLNLKLNKQDARQGGEGKTKRGQGWRDKVQTCWLSRVIGANFSLVHDVGETDTWPPEKGGGKRQRAVFTNSAVGKQKRGGYIYKKARSGRQPFEKSTVRVGWLNNQNEHYHMHQKASHWSQSAGYGFRERHKSDVCCKKKQSTKHEAQVHLLASLLCMRGMTQCMGWSVSGGGGTSYTVLRYVIYQTTVNTVTSRAKTGGSRHQTDART